MPLVCLECIVVRMEVPSISSLCAKLEAGVFLNRFLSTPNDSSVSSNILSTETLDMIAQQAYILQIVKMCEFLTY